MGEDALVIRSAGPDDVGRLGSLRREWCQETDGDVVDGEPFDEAFAEWYAAELGCRVFFLAESRSLPTGMLNLTVFERMPRVGRPASRWCYLGNAFVLSAHRNRGVGAALLRAATEWADRRGAARIVLAPSEPSIPLYERAGFAQPDAGELLVRRAARPRGGGTGRAGSSGRTSRP